MRQGPRCAPTPPALPAAAIAGAVGNNVKQNRINPVPKGGPDAPPDEKKQGAPGAGRRSNTRHAVLLAPRAAVPSRLPASLRPCPTTRLF